jgi:CheY-like chemotaxis protein
MARSVLVIDDDASARALAIAILQPAGYTVRSAEGGEQGLLLAQSATPDLVLLDVEMPGLDGYEVCRRLREAPETRGIPVVMLTATDDPALNRRAYAAGAQACVLKPFRREALLAVLDATLPHTSRETPRRESP